MPAWNNPDQLTAALPVLHKPLLIQPNTGATATPDEQEGSALEHSGVRVTPSQAAKAGSGFSQHHILMGFYFMDKNQQ